MICPYPLVVNYLKNLNFSGADEYKTAERHIWRVDNDVAGYVKQAGNLTEILVRNAGNSFYHKLIDIICIFNRMKSFYNFFLMLVWVMRSQWINPNGLWICSNGSLSTKDFINKMKFTLFELKCLNILFMRFFTNFF